MRVNFKEIFGIFDCYNFEQILDRLTEGKAYLEKGEEEFPIDLTDSLEFLEDMEDLFKCLVYSGQKKEHWEENWPSITQDERNGFLTAKNLQDYGTKLKILNAEMQMVLTSNNMENYLRVTAFINTLLEVIGEREI